MIAAIRTSSAGDDYEVLEGALHTCIGVVGSTDNMQDYYISLRWEPLDLIYY
jgi:hypothetical protein